MQIASLRAVTIKRLMVVAGWLLALASMDAAALEIYFVRHAETMANVTGVHTTETSATFSPRGEEQIAQLTAELKRHRFDAILVSSLPRALNTVLPYLRESNQKAETWPELAECCWQKPPGDKSEGKLIAAAPIVLNNEQRPHFTFRDSASQFDYRNASHHDGVMQVARAVELLKQRYFGSQKTILIVAHYHSGQELISQLLELPRQKLPSIKNGELIHLRQNDAGRIELLPPPNASSAEQ